MPSASAAAFAHAALLLLAALLLACQSEEAPRPAGPPRFEDVAAEVGLAFVHARGTTEHKHIFETMGSGAALFDADGDGDLDVFVVDGTTGPGRGHRLFRNEGGRFTDVTAESGFEGEASVGMGCVAGDYDNDGDQDLYVLSFGENRLYRNDGRGVFEDVTVAAGAAEPRWSVSACFVDVDEDGWLDLYVANYLDYDVETAHPCYVEGRMIPIHCPPKEYPGAPDTLFRNRGDGTFEDISEPSGIRVSPPGKGMGVAALDFDDDGHRDLYVANDSVPNFLLRGGGGGHFEELGHLLGVALSGDGNPEAGMGIAIGDYDLDGDLDLYVTNFMNESNTLYRKDGPGFRDVTASASLNGVTRPFVGFGTFFFDYDHDGWLDLFVTNGHVDDNIAEYWPNILYAEPDLLLRGGPEGRFRNVSLESGSYFSKKLVGRGASVGDIDGDGDLDVLVTNSGGPLVLLRQEGGPRRHYLRVRLEGTESNRDALGSRVWVEAGGRRQVRELISGGSYASDSERVLHFGLGDAERVDRVEIRWPTGRLQVIEGVEADQTLEVVESGER